MAQSKQIPARKLPIVLGLMLGLSGAALHTANADAAPLKSKGCDTQPPLAKGDYTEKDWPIHQPIHEPGPNPRTIWRTFNVHVPPQHEQGSPLPVVINLHGSGGTGAGMDKESRMKEKGDSSGFIVVTPNAWPWPEWTNSADEVKNRLGISDVDFIRMLLDVVVDKMCIDSNQIFATGHSNGGIMSATLARSGDAGKLGSHKIAAIALVAAMPVPATWQPPPWQEPTTSSTFNDVGRQSFGAYLPPAVDPFSDLCRPPDGAVHREAVPMHVFYGNQDRAVANGACYQSYTSRTSSMNPVQRLGIHAFLCKLGIVPLHSGIEGQVESLVKIARCTVNYWAIENRCSPDPVETKPTPNPGGWGVPVSTVTYSCTGVKSFRGDTILTIYDLPDRPNVDPPHRNNPEEPGGHIWPGGVVSGGSFSVTDEIWDFFKAHSR